MNLHPRRFWLAPMLFALAAGADAAPQPAYPAVTVPHSEVRTLKSSATGRTYDLYIRTPTDYEKHPDRKYPVLYLLDGQWDFKLLDSVIGGLVYDKWMPDIIVVGITYSGEHPDYDALRAMDYSPVAGDARGSGDGPKFLTFIRTELIPFTEANYRADPARRVLGGHSFGGLFTLYAMFSDPSLFWGYLAASPNLGWGDNFVVRQEEAFARTHKSLPVRLYVAVGGSEQALEPGMAFARTFTARHYEDLHWEGRVIEGERHSGVKPEFYNRGLRFLFSTE